MSLVDYPKFVLDLKDRMTAEPDLRITGHHLFNDIQIGLLGTDFSLTNISTSPFSISALRIDGIECLLNLSISDGDQGGGRYLNLYEGDKGIHDLPRYISKEAQLPFIDGFPISPYLEIRESMRGLAFWDGDFASGQEVEVSTTILSINREIRASMRIPT